MIKNLSQLKKALVEGAEFEIIKSWRGICNEKRRVNIANTVGIYTIVPDEPSNRITLVNDGKGAFLDWGKASDWEFDNGICYLYNDGEEHIDENLIFALKVKEAQMNGFSG